VKCLNIFTRFIKSIYSPKEVAKYRFLGIGKIILYVFFLMFISILPGLLHFSKMASTALEEGKQVIVEELPPFTISNGNLTSEQSQPIIIPKHNVTIVFDPTGKLSSKDVEDKGNSIGLLKSNFVIVSNGQVQTFPYSALENMKVTNKDIDSFINSLKGVMWIALPIIFLFYYLFVSALGFIKISILAGIGLLLAQVIGRKLNYRQGWRITAHSITLSTIFFMLMDFLNTGVPGGMFIDWFVSLLFLYLSIREIPKPKNPS
jgi:maltodextrin utilization protein YvdJ